MFDINEIMARAKAAQERAAKQMDDLKQRAEKVSETIRLDEEEPQKKREEEEAERARRSAELEEANQKRQREVLAQMMGEEFAKQSAAMQEQVSEEIKKQVASMAAQAQQDVVGALYSDDLSMMSAAFDTYAQLAGDEEEDEEPELSPEQRYEFLETKMSEIDALDEPDTKPYADSPARWQQFCILLSGIISTVNDHQLDSLDVEEHIPLYEQQISNLVRNSWGICGREDLLDTLVYLSRAGYRARFAAYAEAASPEDLFEEETDEEDKEGIVRGWNFVQRFKDKFDADFLLGWDIGRAAMITRWGYFVGWLTRAEALQLLSDMGQVAANGLHGWREFARSYLFGGAFWKEVCAAYDGASYLETLQEAVRKLLADGGPWNRFPWAQA